MKNWLILFVLLTAALTAQLIANAAQDQPTDEQLIINYLQAQNAYQARVIQNLQKQLKECKPVEKN